MNLAQYKQQYKRATKKETREKVYQRAINQLKNQDLQMFVTYKFGIDHNLYY